MSVRGLCEGLFLPFLYKDWHRGCFVHVRLEPDSTKDTEHFS